MRYQIIFSIIVAVLISFLSSYIVYFGFTSNYNSGYYSEATFTHAFDRGVFKYRILSKELLIRLNRFMDAHYPDPKANRQVLFMDPKGSNNFYRSFFYLNTFFLALTSIMLVLLFYHRDFSFTSSERNILIFFVPILINVSQFAIYPYDISSYFLELLIIYVFLKYFHQNYHFSLIILCLLVIVFTLNRESSALTVSLLIVLIICKMGVSEKSLYAITFISLSFLVTFLALAIFIKEPSGEERMFSGGAGDYTRIENNMGLLFWALFFYLSFSMSLTAENKRLIILYHIVSLPYSIFVVFFTILWEVRLYIPLFLGSVFLSRLNAAELVFPTSRILEKITDYISPRKADAHKEVR